MDPLCHTFVGSTLAGTRLGRQGWGATPTLLLAANLPDLDVLAYLAGADTALGFRRGWTHGVLAQLFLPLLLAATVIAVGRRRGAPVRPRLLVGLAYLGLLTHPFLDWLNTYGMRWWMPFDPTWLYGDTLFIVDPWLWLLLGGASFAAWSRGRRAALAWVGLAAGTSVAVLATPLLPPATRLGWVAALAGLATWRAALGPCPAATARRMCALALALAIAYVGSLAALGSAARRAGRQALQTAGGSAARDLLAAPRAGDPFGWDLLAVEPGRYRTGRYRAFGAGAGATFDAGPIASGAADRRVARALEAPCVRGMRSWLRYPFFVVDESGPETVVHILDARYTRGVTRGFGGAAVRLDASGAVVGCD